MAFNPFRGFRKHQKVIMASMVFVAMATFVLCGGIYGQGDFASWFKSTFMGRSRATDVAKLYGKAIEYPEIERLRQQRRLANDYMTNATALVAGRIVTKAQQSIPKLDERIRGTVSAVIEFRSQVALQAEIARLTGGSVNQYVRLFHLEIDSLTNRDRQGLKDKPGDAEVLDELKVALQLDAAAILRGRQQLYFGGTSSDKDLLDFMIWRHQADRLGIHLAPKDVQNAIRRETYNQLTKQDSLGIEEFLGRQSQRGTPVTAETLYTALADEFRVRMAQEALLGSEFDSSPQVPSMATPREFWDFYRNNLTTIQVALFPVKVDEFTGKVKDEPTEKEIQELFQQYRDSEYKPESDKPGFKQPRKVQIEWVAGKAESPIYQRRARELLLSLLTTTPSSPLPALGPMMGLTHRLRTDYDILTLEPFGGRFDDKSFYRLPPLTERSFVLPFYTTASGPEGIADLVSSLGGNSVLSAITTYQAGAVARQQPHQSATLARETHKRVAAGVTLFLATTQPAPVLTFGGMWNTAASETYPNLRQFLPLEALSPQLTRRLEDVLAHDILIASLEEVEKKLQEFIKSKDKNQDRKALEAYLAKTVKELGLETGKMTEPRDQHAIADDKGLKPFRDAYVLPPARDPQAKNFAQYFFTEERPFEPQRWPRGSWRTAAQSFVYWKLDDKPSKTVQLTDPGVRDKVKSAWRTLKARELAKKAAEELAVKVRETKGDIQKLRDLGAQPPKHEVIEPLSHLAHLTREKQAIPMRGGPYSRDELPKELQDKITYPRREMAADILKLQDKKPGETVIVPDQPEQVFYVTVLLKQTEPSQEEFFRACRGTAIDVGLPELFGLFEKERREKYRKEVLEQLRLEARLEINEANLRKLEQGDRGEE